LIFAELSILVIGALGRIHCLEPLGVIVSTDAPEEIDGHLPLRFRLF
jgi:hypothetical protein